MSTDEHVLASFEGHLYVSREMLLLRWKCAACF